MKIDIEKMIDSCKVELEMFKSDFADVKTSDGKEATTGQCLSVMVTLAGISTDRILAVKEDKFFIKIAKNFIKSNTMEDIDKFTMHHLALQITNLFT